MTLNLNNCEITKIYQIIEYQPKMAFRSFIKTVIKYRLEGDQIRRVYSLCRIPIFF